MEKDPTVISSASPDYSDGRAALDNSWNSQWMEMKGRIGTAGLLNLHPGLILVSVKLDWILVTDAYLYHCSIHERKCGSSAHFRRKMENRDTAWLLSPWARLVRSGPIAQHSPSLVMWKESERQRRTGCAVLEPTCGLHIYHNHFIG